MLGYQAENNDLHDEEPRWHIAKISYLRILKEALH